MHEVHVVRLGTI